jgi:hypothetical protein
MFQPTSRYYTVEIAELTAGDRVTRYVRRRFIPRTPITPMGEYTVNAGDRLDNLSARFLGDPEQFWRICDANLAERPSELTDTVGRTLVIPAPALR